MLLGNFILQHDLLNIKVLTPPLALTGAQAVLSITIMSLLPRETMLRHPVATTIPKPTGAPRVNWAAIDERDLFGRQATTRGNNTCGWAARGTDNGEAFLPSPSKHKLTGTT